MTTEKQKELELLLKQAQTAYEDEVDFDKAYKLFKKALKIDSTNPEILIKHAINECFVDIDKNEYESAQALLKNLKNAVENGLMNLDKNIILELYTIIGYCVDNNKHLHEDSIKSNSLSHNDLVINIRAIEKTTEILEYIVSLFDSDNKIIPNYFREPYLEALKEISLRYSIMFGKYECRDCLGLCEATNWSYPDNLEKKFNEVNEKILNIDPTYIIPKKAKKRSKFSIFMTKLFRNKNKYCKKCNKKLVSADLVKTAVMGTETTESAVYARIGLIFLCKDCSEVSQNIIKVTVKSIDSNGWLMEHSIDEQITYYLER